jgi:hypothetical protein
MGPVTLLICGRHAAVRDSTQWCISRRKVANRRGAAPSVPQERGQPALRSGTGHRSTVWPSIHPPYRQVSGHCYRLYCQPAAPQLQALLSSYRLYCLLPKRLYPLRELLHRHALREVPRLVDVRPLEDRAVIREQLQRDRVHGRRLEVAHMPRHLDHVHSVG